MITHRRFMITTAGLLLSSFAIQAAPARLPDAFAVKPSGGFLTKAEREPPRAGDSHSPTFVDSLCARTRESIACPPSAANPASGIDDLAADLPHLHMKILLTKMKNVVVSGNGVGSLGLGMEPWASFKIVSSNADSSIPGQFDAPYGLPVPAPGDTWDVPHYNQLYHGVIENGCLGPATFDLTLDSTVFRVSTGDELGAVHLTDAVEDPGYYTFKYTIRATDESGNVSDFVFSGDANAYCSGKLDLQAEAGMSLTLTGSAATMDTSQTTLAARPDSEFLTRQDIEESKGGYELIVPDVGTVNVTEIRAPSEGKTCKVHMPSLVKAISEDPPTTVRPKWLELAIWRFPWGIECHYPLGGGCYIMVQKVA